MRFPISNLTNTHEDGSGVGAFGELGVQMFRTQHIALSAALRIDAPFYELGDAYVMPLSLNVAMLFH